MALNPGAGLLEWSLLSEHCLVAELRDGDPTVALLDLEVEWLAFPLRSLYVANKKPPTGFDAFVLSQWGDMIYAEASCPGMTVASIAASASFPLPSWSPNLI